VTKINILPPRDYGDDNEKQLAEKLNDMASKMLTIVDAACRLRSAPSDAKRQRAMMRTHLENAAQCGLNAFTYANDEGKTDG
jgi:hypothetical protein